MSDALPKIAAGQVWRKMDFLGATDRRVLAVPNLGPFTVGLYVAYDETRLGPNGRPGPPSEARIMTFGLFWRWIGRGNMAAELINPSTAADALPQSQNPGDLFDAAAKPERPK
jgi:hypothetical protein